MSTHEDDTDERAAEAEIAAAVAASRSAAAAADAQPVTGLGPSPAPLYVEVRPAHKPAQYPGAVTSEGEKSPLLTYFAIPGLGEAIRLLLAEIGADYDHLAVAGGEEQAVAAEWRARSPNGLLPILSGWGVPRSEPIGQSGAILRHLAKRCGLAGSNDVDAARADALYECAKDLGGHAELISSKDPEKDMTSYKLPFVHAGRLEKMLTRMADPSDHDAALNFGQIELYNVLRKCELRRAGCVGENLSEALDGFRKSVESRPGIASYLKSGASLPFTKGELGQEGGYVYTDGAVVNR